jgi:hypothetical protein
MRESAPRKCGVRQLPEQKIIFIATYFWCDHQPLSTKSLRPKQAGFWPLHNVCSKTPHLSRCFDIGTTLVMQSACDGFFHCCCWHFHGALDARAMLPTRMSGKNGQGARVARPHPATRPAPRLL